MGSKVWKKFEQSDGFRRLKLKFKQIVGKEPNLKIDIQLNTQKYPSWTVVADLINENDIVYSIGICDDIAFDLEIIEQENVQLFAFDPTPYSVDWINKQTLPSEFQFFPWAVSDKNGTFFFYPRVKKNGKTSDIMYTFHKQEEQRDDGINVDAFTLESIAKKLGHQKIDVLKMDIEGAEYDVLENMLSTSMRPKLLLIEFHHRFKGIGKDKTIHIVRFLREEGYLVVDISATGREICFVHKKAIPN